MTKLWVNDVEHDFIDREEIEGIVKSILEMERQTILVEVANKAIVELIDSRQREAALKDELIALKVAALKPVEVPVKKREGFFKEFKDVLKKSFSDKEPKK
jgi:hypothetical protein